MDLLEFPRIVYPPVATIKPVRVRDEAEWKTYEAQGWSLKRQVPRPPEPLPVPVKSIEQRLRALESQIAELLAAKANEVEAKRGPGRPPKAA